MRSWTEKMRLFPEKTTRTSAERLILFVRVVLMAGAVFAIGWGLTTTVGCFSGALGAAMGVFFGEYLSRSRLRLWLMALLMLFGVLLGLACCNVLVSWSVPVDLLGISLSLSLSEGLRWWLGSLGIISLLRASSARHPSLVLFELLLPLMAAASLLASHREGNLHRPQWLADWAIEEGQDPIWYLMMFGLLGAIFLAVGLLRLRKSTQFFGALALLTLLFSGFFLLSSNPSVLRALRGGGAGGRGQSQQNDNQNHMSFRPPPPSSGRQRPVAIVLFEHDFKPPNKIFYFRQRTLSRYNGIRLKQAIRSDADKEMLDHFPATGVSLKIPPMPGTRRLVRTRISLLSEHVSPFGLVHPRVFKGLPNPNRRLFLRSYQVDSQVWTGKIKLKDKVGDPKWSSGLRSFYTKAPEDKRYKALLKTILAPLAKTPYRNDLMAKAYMIKLWLERNATYSLSIKTPRGTRDLVAHFLFNTRIGYCVHFSHAAVYLMRLAGVPARMAEGYAVPLRHKGTSSSMLVREAEAHAWPEVFVQGAGWVVFDIYPRRSLDQQIPPPDPKLRQMMANLARKKQSWRQKRSQKQQKKKAKAAANSWSMWSGFVWWCLLGAFVALYALKYWRRNAYRWAAHPKRLFLFYRGMEDRLSELGLRREFGETPGHFALRISEEIPSMRAMVNRMTALRLGSSLEHLQFRKGHERTLLNEYSQMRPTFRRFLAALDPISWSLHTFQSLRKHPPLVWRTLRHLGLWLAGLFVSATGVFRRREERENVS